MSALQKIQCELKAPKIRNNSFGKYAYRNCEDILEALKPLLVKHKAVLVISDEIQNVGNVVVVTAKVTLTDIESSQQTIVTAHAGVDINKKGMDIAQTFGASSSYARKYALNGMFLIDDTKDYDSDEYHNQVQNQNQKQQQIDIARAKKQLDDDCVKALADIQHAENKDVFLVVWNHFKNTVHAETIQKAIVAKRDKEGWSA